MKWRGSSNYFGVAGAYVAFVVALLLSACKFGDCARVLKRQVSRGGRFVAEVQEAGNCFSSLNTIVIDVKLTDTQGWLFANRVVLTAKGLSDVQLVWLASNQLAIRYSYPGQVPDRILRRENRWRDVLITYEESPFNGR